jgi:hypothetical protein
MLKELLSSVYLRMLKELLYSVSENSKIITPSCTSECKKLLSSVPENAKELLSSVYLRMLKELLSSVPENAKRITLFCT